MIRCLPSVAVCVSLALSTSGLHAQSHIAPAPEWLDAYREPAARLVGESLATDFAWQRSPFEAATPSAGDPHDETPGLDLVLPYWMGRYHGAF